MKKIFFSLLAVAAMAACAKTEVAYEAAGEIGFAPATKNITKATGFAGTLENTQKLGVWAYWDNDAEVGTNGTLAVGDTYGNYTDNYLINALFASKSTSNWGGDPTGYPWPVNGALVFAGYTTPEDALLSNTAVSYDLATNTMTFTAYENANEFDLCWFGRTPNAYNYRSATTAVPVTLSHALSWVSVEVKAEGAPIGWKIKSMSLEKATTVGTATCVGTSATWTSSSTEDIVIYRPSTGDEHLLTEEKTKLTDNIVIPCTPVNLTVNYSFMVNGVEKTDSKTVSLKLNNENTENWQNGVHYTYTLLFKGTEILIAPSYGVWSEQNFPITVE